MAARSRHVCLFLGAGASKACGLPDVEELEEIVLDSLAAPEETVLRRLLEGRTLEQVLSRLRRIAGLVSGEAAVDGLRAKDAESLDNAVCRAIVDALSVESASPTAAHYLAVWAARANYRLPVELFTVNYDLLLESALEHVGAPYFDGFVGALEARFHTELVEATEGRDDETVPRFFVRLWKLHGSVNWVRREEGGIVRLGQVAPNARPAAIYPSDTKYEESRRVPFLVLQDQFRRALHRPETLVLISGYSFGDEHLNEHIYGAATRRARSEFIVFCFDEIPEPLADRAMLTPNLQVLAAEEAIIGGVRGNWQEPKTPVTDAWRDDAFTLVDFNELARHLARSTAPQHEDGRALEELLERLGVGGGPAVEGGEKGG